MFTEANIVEHMNRYAGAASGGYEPLLLGKYRLGHYRFLDCNRIHSEKGQTDARS